VASGRWFVSRGVVARGKGQGATGHGEAAQMDRQLSRRHSLLLWQVVRFPSLSRAEIVSSLSE